jgi:hypothetical protein
MEPQETADAPWKPRPERYAAAVIITVFASLGLFAVFIGLDRFCPGLRDAPAIALWLSLAGGYLVAPLLGLFTISVVRESWSFTALAGCAEADRERTSTIVRRLLTAGFLLAVLGGLPTVPVAVYGFSRGLLLPCWLAGWLILTVLTASALGYFAFQLSRKHGRWPVRAGTVAVAALGLGSALVISSMTSPGSYLVQRATYARQSPAFSGDSKSLMQTLVVLTLDSPCPPGRNVVWCSSFQLAWNELKENVVGEPLEVVGAEDVAARLNAAPQSSLDLTPESFYAAAGWTKDGIVDKVKHDMAVKFPSRVLPDLDAYGEGLLAYSYLKANVAFKHPFRQLVEGLTFTDSGGIKMQVAGFGLWEAHRLRYRDIREQVDVLYSQEEDREHPWELGEYALDLCKYSEPYQVVVARVERKGTLGDTLAYVGRQVEEFRRRADYPMVRKLQEHDEVRVPQMFWKVNQRFHELIGRTVGNVGLPIVEAMQTIEFRLDRYGVALESASMTMIAAIPRRFLFDRPFLVYMQKRGAERPFFVMWLDNAELLTRR